MTRSLHSFLSLLMSSSLAACMNVPEEPSDGPFDLDAAVRVLALDASVTRPPTGEPYTGPECDTSPADPRGPASADGGFAGAADAASGASGGEAPPAAGEGATAGAAPGRPAEHGAIVITELMTDPRGVRDDAGEWFELHNPSERRAFDLNGCTVDDGSAAPRNLRGALVIEPGGHAVVARSAEAGVPAQATLAFSLGNAADVLGLHCDGVLIDRVAYGPNFPLAPGASLSLDRDAIDAVANDDPSHWCRGQAGYAASDLGSPGAENPDCADADAG